MITEYQFSFLVNLILSGIVSMFYFFAMNINENAAAALDDVPLSLLVGKFAVWLMKFAECLWMNGEYGLR